ASGRTSQTGPTLARHADSLLAPGRALPGTAATKPAHPGETGPRDADPDIHADTYALRPEDTYALRPEDVVRDAPLRWFQEEITGLVAAVRQAHAAELWSLTWKLSNSLTCFFQASAGWAEWAAINELALDAARRAGDAAAQASVLQSQGDLAWQQRQVEQAAACYELAIHQARRVHDQCAEARALIGLADVLLDRGIVERARTMYAQSLVLCRAGHDLRGLTDALRGLALAELRRGRCDAALDRFTECRAVASQLGDRRWSEFARRAVERIRTGPAAEGSVSFPVEVRPGVWLIGGTPYADSRPGPPDPEGDRGTDLAAAGPRLPIMRDQLLSAIGPPH
ncbi:tetratricopeptide repeat protein, partial [Frankia sp. CcWB2]